MTVPSLSIIVASAGRPSLARTLESARAQMRDGDELLVAVQTDCPWGHKARNQLMDAARCDALMFIDDDDTYLPGALDVARAGFAAARDRLHIFRMRYANGDELWQQRLVVCGNVSTQMVIAPRKRVQLARSRYGHGLPRWREDAYEGDYHFIRECAEQFGEPVWHEQVIALIRPETV